MKFIIVFLLSGFVSCYKKPNKIILPKYPDNFEGIERLSNFSNLICEGIEDVKANKIAFRSKAYRKFNPEEKFKIEECITLAGAEIDTSNRPGSAYIFDSTIYFDIRIINDSNRKYLSLSYPFGWDNWCGTGVIYREFNLEESDSIYKITNEIKK